MPGGRSQKGLWTPSPPRLIGPSAGRVLRDDVADQPPRTGPVPFGAGIRGRQTEHRANRFTRARAGQVRAYRKRVGSLYLAGFPAQVSGAQKGQRMRIERRFTKDGQSPYAEIEFRLTTSEIRNPDGSVVFKADNVEVPAFWSQVAVRRAGAEVFPQGRRPGAAEEGRGRDRPLVPVALGRRRGRARRAAGEGAHRRRDLGEAGVRPARRHLDLLGLEGRLFRLAMPTRRPSSTSCATCWRRRWSRRTRRSGSTPACTGPTASMGRARATTTSTSRPAS